MACRKCGSSWKTARGRDCASCPHCCKLARCNARKQGRWVEPEAIKKCDRCGCDIRVVGMHAIATVRLCESCRPIAKKEWRADYCREYKKRRKAGCTPVAEGRPRPVCPVCSNEFSTDGKKRLRCSKACFFIARERGDVAWDRSAIDEAARNRPGDSAGSPWLYVPHEGGRNFACFMRKLKRFTAVAMRRVYDCRVCGRACLGNSNSHCSRRCIMKHLESVPCVDCKEPFDRGGTSTAKRCTCCASKAERRSRNRLAGNHRKRCRKNGVPFDPSIKSKDVFARDNYVCHVCKRKTLAVFTVSCGRVHPRSPTVDHHPYPLAAGVMGHVWDNVRCACFECNWKKGAEWSRQLPFPLHGETPTG